MSATQTYRTSRRPRPVGQSAAGFILQLLRLALLVTFAAMVSVLGSVIWRSLGG